MDPASTNLSIISKFRKLGYMQKSCLFYHNLKEIKDTHEFTNEQTFNISY